MTENVLELISKSGEETEPDKKEALRYMGCKGDILNEEFWEIYDECLKEYKAVASYKALYRKTSVVIEGDIVDLGFCKIENEALCKNLRGCNEAFVFAATAGVAVDRLIRKYSKISPVKAMMIGCIASSGIEVWCDEVNAIFAKRGRVKPRFSPGYGGVSLVYQKDILRFLDAERKIGLTLSEGLMMIPVKSVTAFVGKEKENED